jgi:hypothetical protein
MANDILQQLADWEVPQPPTDLANEVHQRLNSRLTAVHLIEFVGGTVPYAMWEFLRAISGLARYTLSGKYDEVDKRHHDA